MRLQRAIVFFVAIFFAIAAGGLAFWFTQEEDEPEVAGLDAPVFGLDEEPEEEVIVIPTTDILTAARSIAPGEVFGENDVEWTALPDVELREEYVTFIANPLPPYDALQRVGVVAATLIAAGAPITADLMVEGFFSLAIAPDKRALAVNVSPDNSPSSLISPGDRVDIILNRAANPLDAMFAGERVPEPSSELLLSNVRVLALDSSFELGEFATGTSPATAILELSLEDILFLEARRQEGVIKLVLHGFVSSEDGERRGMATPSRQQSLVRVVRGGSSQVVTVKRTNP